MPFNPLPLPRSLLIATVLVFLSGITALPAETPTPRERQSFNADWRFTRGDGSWTVFDAETAMPWMLSSSASLLGPLRAKPARPTGNLASDFKYVQPAFDDTSWRKLDLPHDWGIEGAFQQDLPGDTGKLPWAGVGWYRKKFSVPSGDAGRRVSLEIDGAMSHSTVWLNGQFAGGWAYGYASFSIDLTPYLKPGADNVLAIRLDNPPESSRWYPGGGLYRNVWLTKTAPIHVAHWGTFVTTPQVSASSAAVHISALLENETSESTDVSVRTELFKADASGKISGSAVAASEPTASRLPNGRQVSVSHELKVVDPILWSLGQPQRYVAVTTVEQNGQTLDRYETPFGIRSAVFDAARGFLLNGEPVRIQGVCMHHDLGALGTAVNTRAIERQLEILRAMGCNAIRTTHNPPAPELLDACDRMGFLVMDEAFDCWAMAKTRNDYHRLFPAWHEQDLRALVRRDRNHPSIILWSIGNEIVEQWGDHGTEGWKLTAHLAGLVREEDRSRAITAGFNNAQSGFNGMQLGLDAVGYNYKVDAYASFRKTQPSQPVYGSETASTISSRGEYFFPFSDDKLDPAARTNFQISSYDLSAPEWATSPDAEWRAADGAPGYAGEFVWTGFDYIGEPTPYGNDATNLLNFSDPAAKERVAKQLAELGKIPVPSRSSYFGIIDLAGFPKDRFYLYQARWRPDLPMAHILPHWNWAERAGAVTPVHVYTSGDEAELFLNDRSLGRKKKAAHDYRLRWDDVKYEPGTLKVVAYKEGKRWAEALTKTAGEPKQLALTSAWVSGEKVDRTSVKADGKDLAFLSVAINDAGGNLVPRAQNRVRFTVSGPGEIVATDNGDATSFESFQSPQRQAYNGRVLAIVRAKAGQPAKITVRAESDGLTAATCVLESQ